MSTTLRYMELSRDTTLRTTYKDGVPRWVAIERLHAIYPGVNTDNPKDDRDWFACKVIETISEIFSGAFVCPMGVKIYAGPNIILLERDFPKLEKRILRSYYSWYSVKKRRHDFDPNDHWDRLLPHATMMAVRLLRPSGFHSKAVCDAMKDDEHCSYLLSSVIRSWITPDKDMAGEVAYCAMDEAPFGANTFGCLIEAKKTAESELELRKKKKKLEYKELMLVHSITDIENIMDKVEPESTD